MQNEKQDHSEFLMVLLVLLMVGMTALINYKYHWFVYIWYYMKMPIYAAVNNLPREIFDFGYSWVLWDNNFIDNIKSIGNVLQSYSVDEFMDEVFMDEQLEPNNVTLREFVSYTNKVTATIYLPFILPIIIFLKNKIQKKRRFVMSHTMDSLGIQESELWKPIKPVIHETEQMTKTKSLDEGWFAMSPKPDQFFKKNNMLDTFKNEDKTDIENFGNDYYKLNIDTSYKIFIKQLGDPWYGVDRQRFHEKALIALFFAKTLRDKQGKESFTRIKDNLCDYYSSIPSKKGASFFNLVTTVIKFDMKQFGKIKARRNVYNALAKKIRSDAKKAKKTLDIDIAKTLAVVFGQNIYKRKMTGKKILVEKAVPHEMMKDALQKHFYKYTVFACLLEKARTTGVLASCEFIWLKKADRSLWYMMSQTGRTACFVECSGAWAHYVAEKKVCSKLVSPMILKAITAADKYMSKTHDNYESIETYE
jgi:hypothetical protein